MGFNEQHCIHCAVACVLNTALSVQQGCSEDGELPLPSSLHAHTAAEIFNRGLVNSTAPGESMSFRQMEKERARESQRQKKESWGLLIQDLLFFSVSRHECLVLTFKPIEN